jgi:hypothetical protein
MGQKQCALLLVLLMLFALPVTSIQGELEISSKSEDHINIIQKGMCTNQENITILHVNGTHYEMGYQHGYYLRDKVQENLRAFIAYTSYSYEELVEIWNQMKPYVPDEYLEEMQGLADGAEVNATDVAAAYMVIVVGDIGGCFGVSTWGRSTSDGELIHVRSFDQPMDIQDPITGTYVHENAVLVIRNPTDGYASISPSVAGSMHGGGGMNSQAIALGQQVCWSNDYTFHGIPALLRVQMALDHASILDDAVKILTENKTLGWNFIVSDGKLKQGVAVEVTGNHSYIGTYDNPAESNKPFWSLQDTVRRTNFFIDPTIAGTQRESYNPGGFIPFIKLVQRKDIFYAIWRSYKAVSEEFERQQGTLNLTNTMTMFQNTYSGGTDPLLRYIITKAEGTSFNRAWNMWTATPVTGDLLVSYAGKETSAFATQIHTYNLYDLLEQFQ